MASFQSRMLIFMMRHRHWMQFRLKPERIDDSMESILGFRETVEKSAKLYGGIPDHLRLMPVQIGDLYAEWIEPARYNQPHTILYFHGGGYVAGSCAAHHGHLDKIVTGSGIRALLFEYGLAPEQPYPAALEDALAAYRYLLAQDIAPEHIVFMGDSAGAGLVLATLVALRDQGDPLPAGAVPLSPWTDLKCTGDTYRTNARTCFSPQDSWTVFSKYYVGDHDPTDPWISPLYADLTGLPPLRIYVGSDEIYLDDARRFTEKAKAAGVDVELTIGEGMFHCYPVCVNMFPEATEAMHAIWDFLRERLGLEPRALQRSA